MAGGAFIGGVRTAAQAARAFSAELRAAHTTLGGFEQTIRDLQRGTEGFARASEGISGVVDEIRRQQSFTGGTTAQIGGLGAAFGLAGLTPASIAPIADAFRERLFRDPIAIGAFGRSVLPGRMGGPTDSARILNEAIEMLREITDVEQRRTRALKLGLEVLLPLANLDEKHYQAMKREGELKGALAGPELQRVRAVAQSQKQVLSDLEEERALTAEKINTERANWWRDRVQIPFAQWQNRAIRERAQRGLDEQARGGGGRRGGFSAEAEALDRNTEALQISTREVINGRIRSERAIPSQASGTFIAEHWEKLSLTWGAWFI